MALEVGEGLAAVVLESVEEAREGAVGEVVELGIGDGGHHGGGDESDLHFCWCGLKICGERNQASEVLVQLEE